MCLKICFYSFDFYFSAWLKSTDHPTIDRVNERIEAVTNLEVDTAEELQVANYGIGGHYEPHYDFARVRIVALELLMISVL